MLFSRWTSNEEVENFVNPSLKSHFEILWLGHFLFVKLKNRLPHFAKQVKSDYTGRVAIFFRNASRVGRYHQREVY